MISKNQRKVLLFQQGLYIQGFANNIYQMVWVQLSCSVLQVLFGDYRGGLVVVIFMNVSYVTLMVYLRRIYHVSQILVMYRWFLVSLDLDNGRIILGFTLVLRT